MQSLTSGIPKSAFRGVTNGAYKIAKTAGADAHLTVDDVKAQAYASKNKLLQMAQRELSKAEAEVQRVKGKIATIEQEIYNLQFLGTKPKTARR